MWLSKQNAGLHEEIPAEVGSVTMSEPDIAVYTDTERRKVPMYGPGGYRWRPKTGENVLVIKTGDENCAVGTETSAGNIGAGEICIESDGNAKIFLKNNGAVEISASSIILKGYVNVEGGFFVNGTPVG